MVDALVLSGDVRGSGVCLLLALEEGTDTVRCDCWQIGTDVRRETVLRDLRLARQGCSRRMI